MYGTLLISTVAVVCLEMEWKICNIDYKSEEAVHKLVDMYTEKKLSFTALT